MVEGQKNLFKEFKSSSKKDWARKAGATVTDGDRLQNYNWQFEENIALEPYYDHSDLGEFHNLNAFHNRLLLKENPAGEIRYWENTQKIIVKDTNLSNQLALEALRNGVDGIIFDLNHVGNIPLDRLLKNILVEHCTISFITGEHFNQHLSDYCDFLVSEEVDPLSVTGIFSVENIALSGELHSQAFKKTINYPHVKVFNLCSDEPTTTAEIADLLIQSVSILEEFSAQFDPQQVVSKMAVTIPVSTDYFGTIAKIRAVRMLLFQVFRAFKFDTYNPEDIHIHCVSTSWVNEKYQPHSNMLKSATAAMAAIIGGCDSLLVEPEDHNNSHMVRIARNVSTILKEESYFNRTADPAAGSYFLEVLTSKIAQKAWECFQQRCSESKWN